MKNIFKFTCLLLAGFYSHDAFCAEEKDAVKCPELSSKDMKLLNGEHILPMGEHKWYLHDMFELPETLGSHVPLDLSIDDVMAAKEVDYFGQLDAHTCQYKIILGKDRKANVTFKLMGE